MCETRTLRHATPQRKVSALDKLERAQQAVSIIFQFQSDMLTDDERDGLAAFRMLIGARLHHLHYDLIVARPWETFKPRLSDVTAYHLVIKEVVRGWRKRVPSLASKWPIC